MWLVLSVPNWLLATPASGDEERTVHGVYVFVVGWNIKPPLTDEPNAMVLKVTNKALNSPVQGLEKTLSVVAIHGDKPVGLVLLATQGTPGNYTAKLKPTNPGEYVFEISGTVEGNSVREKFGPDRGLIEVVRRSSIVQFPVPEVVSSFEISSQAELAKTASEKALSISGTAKTDSEKALTAANSAKTDSEKALTAANSAKTDSGKALTAANSAKTDSEKALTAAGKAETAARAAETAATTAQGNAVKAETAARAAETAATGAQGNAAKAEAAARAAETAAKAAQGDAARAETAVEAAQIKAAVAASNARLAIIVGVVGFAVGFLSLVVSGILVVLGLRTR
jgi:tetrahydromethanopterin S-methyltransferase subunit F